MGFRVGTIARVWSCDDKGKYSTCNVSVSKLNRETNTYDTDFRSNFVNFVGQANEDIKKVGLPTANERKNGDNKTSTAIIIKNCDVTNFYAGNTGNAPTDGASAEKSPYTARYAVFEIELPDANGNFASLEQSRGNSSQRGASNYRTQNSGYKQNKSPNDLVKDIPEDADEELPFK